jgi:TonB-linked SusC/RagA family outer membrane protein
MKHHALFRWAFAILGACALWVASAAPATAQQRGTIRGTVREAASQRPVDGVQVFVPGTQLTTTTDAQGRFELAGVPAGGAQVRVRAPGFSSALATTMVVGGQTVTVDFALNTSVIALDEVVVTGTGASVERKQLGNTIATVKADVIQDAPVQNFSEALTAREAGVSILPSSGLAGEGARIRIRGNASLSQSNEPVVYVDGVRVDNGGGFAEGVGAGGAGTTSRLDDINPETIDHVEILKGAAAATMYGSEASAGVIQIFTKKGTQGRPKFSFRIDQGGTKYPNTVKDNFGFARTQAQADKLNAIYGNTVVTPTPGGVKPFEVFSTPDISPSAYYGTGYNSTYSANVAGGGSDATYNVAFRYAREDGPYDVTNLIGPRFIDQLPFDAKLIDFDRRYQGSANVTMFPRERVTVSAGLMLSSLHHQTPQNANNIYGVQSSLLNSKPENADCSLSIGLPGAGTYGEDTARPGHCAGPGDEWGTLAFTTPREAAFSRTVQDVDHVNANAKTTYEPLQGRLRFDVTGGVDISNSRDHEYRPFGYNVDQFTGLLVEGYKGIGSRYHQEMSLDARMNWNEKLGTALSSQLNVGTQGFISKTHQRFGEGWDFPGPGIEIANAGANQDVLESFSDIVNIGLMAQEQIGYNDWAFVTVGGRWDKNSAFGEKSPSAFYPKVSGSIVFSDMPGWNVGMLSTFRIRGALGRSGLQPGAFDKFTTFQPGTSEFGAGLRPDNLGNQDLKPERTTELEAGAEMGFLNNRLALDGTYWKRTTQDALVSKQYPASGGFLNSQLSNIGELTAHGLELKLNAVAIDRPGLSVNLFANGSYLFQRIVTMGGAAPIKVGGSYPRYRNFLVAGQAPGVLLGTQPLQPCGETSFSLCLNAGQYPFDVNGDGTPDSRAELEAYLSVPRSLDDFNQTNLPGRGLLLDDNNGNGDYNDHCMGPSRADPIAADAAKGITADPNHRYCLAKPTPDWSGAFGTNITFARNFQFNTLFEFKAKNYYIQNLTDGFRNSNPLIGRNNPRPAEIEAIMSNPASTAAERADALLEFVDDYKELAPYNGLNLAEKGDFLRLREVAVTWTAPSSFAQRLGLNSLAFNLSGRNLAMFTGYSGIDPEMNSNSRGGGTTLDNNFQDGIDAWGFPLPRRFTLSVRFGF